MRIRLIGGKYGGRILDAPDTDKTHPMGERIRNAMFNSIGEDIVGAKVLDAFAGSGAVGLEALSRGADTVLLIDRDRIAQKVIAKNVQVLGCQNETKLIKSSLSQWMSTTEDDQKFDFIFADPPYFDLQLSTIHKLFEYLKPSGTMILSHTGKGEVTNQTNIVVVDNRSYGNAHLTYFRRVE